MPFTQHWELRVCDKITALFMTPHFLYGQGAALTASPQDTVEIEGTLSIILAEGAEPGLDRIIGSRIRARGECRRPS
jgi:hypothetical protein